MFSAEQSRLARLLSLRNCMSSAHCSHFSISRWLRFAVSGSYAGVRRTGGRAAATTSPSSSTRRGAAASGLPSAANLWAQPATASRSKLRTRIAGKPRGHPRGETPRPEVRLSLTGTMRGLHPHTSSGEAPRAFAGRDPASLVERSSADTMRGLHPRALRYFLLVQKVTKKHTKGRKPRFSPLCTPLSFDRKVSATRDIRP